MIGGWVDFWVVLEIPLIAILTCSVYCIFFSLLFSSPFVSVSLCLNQLSVSICLIYRSKTP